MNHQQRPEPKFALNLEIKYPKWFYDGKHNPKIVGYAWAEDNHRAKIKSKTYLYYIKTEPGLEWVLVVGEEELTQWGN